ncbi:MAG: hypothetical protein WD042_18055 [Phycisphaeraceae bacterium]
MDEASEFLDGRGSVHRTLRRLAKRLAQLETAYAVCGGMALFSQGFRRYTADVDVLVTREELKRIHEALDGLGYVPPFAGSKNLRDVEDGVRIEFIITGEYPGDGKPKPVAFPDPRDVAIERDGIRFLDLAPLIELKLASGMTHPGRLKDLADVQELIRIRKLDDAFAQKLNPYVRDKYAQLLAGVRAMPEPHAG